jgi:hypothetical protein
MTYTNGNDTIPDRTASYTIPQMASNNVVINITGGCEYCKAEAALLTIKAMLTHAFCWIDEAGKLAASFITYDQLSQSTNTEPPHYHCASKKIKINYCPICGRKLEVEG